MGVFDEYECTNPKCKAKYFSMNPVAGLCPDCQKAKPKKKVMTPSQFIKVTDKLGIDRVFMQEELVPVQEPSSRSTMIAVAIEAVESTPAEQSPGGFFQELMGTVMGLLDGMEVGWRVSVPILRRIFDVSPDNKSKGAFLSKVLKKALDAGRLKIIKAAENHTTIYQKVR